jgi:4-hydroxy-tetrahydrodipicolinate synthase
MIVYHHPSRTNVRLSVETLVQILSLPCVAGIKEGSTDLHLMNEIRRQLDVPIFCGDDILALAMMAQGAQGVISIVANVIPKEWKKFCSFMLNNDLEHARQLFYSYQELIEAMIIEINPQCVKYALSLMEKCSSRLRLPLTQPRAETRRKIEAAMEIVISPIDLLRN